MRTIFELTEEELKGLCSIVFAKPCEFEINNIEKYDTFLVVITKGFGNFYLHTDLTITNYAIEIYNMAKYIDTIREVLNKEIPKEKEEERILNAYKVTGTYTFISKELGLDENDAIDSFREELYYEVKYPSNVMENMEIKVEFIEQAKKDADGHYLDYNGIDENEDEEEEWTF